MNALILRWPSPVLAAILVLYASGCVDRDGPTGLERGPLETAPAALSMLSNELLHEGPNFAFLPPVRPGSAESLTENDPDMLQHLSMEVCEWNGTACETPLVARLVPGGSPGQGGISLEEEVGEPGHFLALWRVPEASVGDPTTFRIVVRAGTVALGHATTVVLQDNADADTYRADGLVPVVGGSSLSVRFRVRQDRIEGEPTRAVGTEVQEETFVPRSEDYTLDHPTLAGVPISHNTLLLAFRPSTTVAEANEILDRVNGEIVGAIPAPNAVLPALLSLRVPAPDHGALIEILTDLQADPMVLSVAPDILLSTTEVTPTDDAATDWAWDIPADGGNWGMEVSGAPNMWNLNDAIRKAHGDEPSGALVGVVDVGFADTGEHADLVYEVNQTPGTRDDHGTHVAGTIGAVHGNALGVDGMNPFARMVVRAPEFLNLPTQFSSRVSWSASMIYGYLDLMTAYPGVRVVNMSLGYNWRKAGVDSDANLEAQEVANDQGELMALAQAVIEAQVGPLPVLVVAAGNDTEKDARYASPMTNAALAQGDANIIVVEAIDRRFERADFSNIGGHLSAPGVGILSTILPSAYGYKDGTSMAAPHVTGIVSFLYTVDPDLPRPTRTSNVVRDLLLAHADDRTVDGASPRVEGYEAMLDLDRIRGDDLVLRMLIDIDDGSRDGNLRTLLGEISGVPREDFDQDGGPGDGVIDMSDFRRFRDWFVGGLRDSYAELDGSPTHPKRDANGDGVVDAREAVFSRGDFNGNGFLNLVGRRPIPGALGGQELTDLEVLQSRFEDPNYSAEGLDDLVFSADMDIDASACSALVPAGGSVRSTLTGGGTDEGSDSSFGWFQSRTHTMGQPKELFTGRVARHPDPTTVQARAEVVDGSGAVVARADRDFQVWPGSDREWRPLCDAVDPDGQ